MRLQEQSKLNFVCTPTLDDYRDPARVLLRTHRLFGISFTLVGSLCCFLGAAYSSLGLFLAGLFAALPGVIYLWNYHHLVYSVAPKVFESRMGRGSLEISLGPDGVLMKSLDGEAQLKWSAFEHCIEIPNGFILMRTGNLHYTYLCKRHVSPSSLPQIRELLASHVRMSRA